jgi:hypothetical protein
MGIFFEILKKTILGVEKSRVELPETPFQGLRRRKVAGESNSSFVLSVCGCCARLKNPRAPK